MDDKNYLPPTEDPNKGMGETNPEGIIDNPESVKKQLGYNPGDAPKALHDENWTAPTDRPLTNKDNLSSQGLVEIFDPTVDNGKDAQGNPLPMGALRQVSKEAAQKQLENLKQLEKSLEGAK